MDGWIVIGTDIDSKEFDKELSRLKKESEKYAKEEESLLNKKAKLELDTSKTMNELSKIDKKIENINQKMKTIESNNIPENLKNNDNYQNLVNQSEILNAKAEEYLTKLDLQKTNLSGINTKLIENSTHQSEINSKIEEMEAKSLGLHLNFDNIGKSIMNNVKKVGKWAAAVFGLRTAYNTIRQAMSTISTYNDGINNKLYSMKMMFASALEPIITRMVNLAWKLMAYINYIAKAWFGIDLASKASANSIKDGAKSAEKMKKISTSFDEATILNDNGTTGAMGASSSPTFETPEDVEIPSWVKWIADNKDTILKFLAEFGLLLAAAKVIQFVGHLTNMGKGLSKILGYLKGMSGLQIFGLIAGVLITLNGIITTGQGIIAFIKDPSWTNFNKILEGLTLTLVGVGVAMIALKASNPLGWIVLATGAVVGLITVLSNLAQSFMKSKAQILDTKTAQEQLTKAQEDAKKAQDDLTNATDSYINAVDKAEEASKKLTETEKKNKISGEELQKQVDNGVLSYETMDKKQREVYKAYIENNKAQENLKTSQENVTKATNDLTEAKKQEEKASWENQLAIAKESDNYEDFRDAIIDAYEKGELKAEEARDYIERCCADMDTAHANTFTKNIPDKIKEGLDPQKYQSTFTKFKNAWNTFWNGLEKNFTATFSSGDVKTSSKLTSANVTTRANAKGGIVYPQLQYHASGGIINQPGRGVPITQDIGGERGAEGIVPLTDSQQMELLGSAIARNININATIPIYMGNRQIAREIQKINAEQDFAMNR